jgi:mono/diheme cytochrome c family protein
MNLTSHHPARLLLMAVGLVAGAWSIASAQANSTTAETPLYTPMVAPTVPDVARPSQGDTAAAGESPVSYSSEQADRGEEQFVQECVECHGEDLKGGLVGGPPLRGLSFEQKYFEGAPASSLFAYMSYLMPPNSPGRFSASNYADMMAYILKRNGVRPGAPLPSDYDALDFVIMEK